MATEAKEKKRKASAIEPTAEKVKKTKTSFGPADASLGKKTAVQNSTIEKPKTQNSAPRNRAADFLSDSEDEETVPVPSTKTEEPNTKKSKKSAKGHTVENGLNKPVQKVPAVVERDSNTTIQQNGEKKSKKQKSKTIDSGSDAPMTTTSTKLPTGTALMKDKKRTIVEETVGGADDDEETSGHEDDQAATLLAGFDDDEPDTADDTGLDADTPMPGLNKKAKKKLSQLGKKSAQEGPGTVYIGRVPHGFYEHQMRAYFSQFGDITNLRLSRNRKTGVSKHFAFLEFASSEVAKIAAASMDNYLLFGHILKCKFVPQENVHPDTWKGANRRYKATPWNKLEKQKLEQPKTKEKWETKNAKEQKKREEKQKKMNELGYEFKAPQLKSIEDAGIEDSALAAPITQQAIEPAPKADEDKPEKLNKRKEKKQKGKDQKQLDAQLLGDNASAVSTKAPTSQAESIGSVAAASSADGPENTELAIPKRKSDPEKQAPKSKKQKQHDDRAVAREAALEAMNANPELATVSPQLASAMKAVNKKAQEQKDKEAKKQAKYLVGKKGKGAGKELKEKKAA